MPKKVALELASAVSYAVKAARCDLVAAYPITPQSHIAEELAQMVANGELDAKYINVESEHSAISACIGSSATGARTFTATAGQGLALMHEILFIASSLRLPIVMAVTNRALSAPLSIWNDHSDIMAQRDTGWVQLFAQNGQEIFDFTVCAFEIAERVSFPTVINLDGFVLSHVTEPVLIYSEEEVDKFLPQFIPKYKLSPDHPITVGAFAMPEYYTEIKVRQNNDFLDTIPEIKNIFSEFGNIFGRHYEIIEKYQTEDAKYLFLGQGAICETAKLAIDALRQSGEKIGLINLRLFRPFPVEELRKEVGRCEHLMVVDRCFSFGANNSPLCSEIRSVFYSRQNIKISGFVAGLGGRDVDEESFSEMLNIAKEKVVENYPIGARYA